MVAFFQGSKHFQMGCESLRRAAGACAVGHGLRDVDGAASWRRIDARQDTSSKSFTVQVDASRQVAKYLIRVDVGEDRGRT